MQGTAGVRFHKVEIGVLSRLAAGHYHVEPDASGALHVSKPLPGGVVARQQAPVVYEHAASTYVVDPAYLKRSKGLWEGRVIPYLMPPERCVDIDSPFDFTLVEFLLTNALKDQSHG